MPKYTVRTGVSFTFRASDEEDAKDVMLAVLRAAEDYALDKTKRGAKPGDFSYEPLYKRGSVTKVRIKMGTIPLCSHCVTPCCQKKPVFDDKDGVFRDTPMKCTCGKRYKYIDCRAV